MNKYPLSLTWWAAVSCVAYREARRTAVIPTNVGFPPGLKVTTVPWCRGDVLIIGVGVMY